jgi:hypothetical protein
LNTFSNSDLDQLAKGVIGTNGMSAIRAVEAGGLRREALTVQSRRGGPVLLH